VDVERNPARRSALDFRTISTASSATFRKMDINEDNYESHLEAYKKRFQTEKDFQASQSECELALLRRLRTIRVDAAC
jgi:hypothetical protein